MSDLRTFTYVVKMDIGDGTEKSKQFRVTLQTMEQDAKKASAEIDKLTKTIGDKYGVKVTAAIDQTRTVTNEIKATTRETNRAEKAFSQLAREYAHLASRTGKTADEQEVLNAQYRLGSKATKEQLDQTATLVTAYQQQRNAANKTQGSMRGLRGQAQNLGWQLQDIAVQAQMGTDALVILGQQGSQLASGFGGVGALVGAGIAVVSALLGVAVASSKAREDLESTNKIVNILSESFDKLTASQKFIVEQRARKEIKKLNDQISTQSDIVNSTKSQMMLLGNQTGVTAKEQKKATEDFENAKFKLVELKIQLNKYNESLDSFNNNQNKSKDSIGEMIASYYKQSQIIGLNERQLALYEATLIGANEAELIAINTAFNLKKEREDQVDATKELIEANRKLSEIGTTAIPIQDLTDAIKTRKKKLDEQLDNDLARAKQARDLGLGTEEEYQQKIAEIKEEYRKKQSSKDDEERKKAIAENKKLFNIGTTEIPTSYLDKFVKTRKQKLDDQLTEDLDRAKQARDLGIATEEEYQQKVAEIKADYRKKDNKSAEEAQKKLSKSLSVQAKYDPNIKLALLQKQYSEERALLEGNTQALIEIDRHYADERTKINGDVWEKMALSARESIENTDKLMADSLDRFVSGTADAFGNALVYSDNFGDAMSNLFKGGLASMLSYFGELAIQQALSWAFASAGESTLKTERAASQSFINQGTVFEAGLNAFAATAKVNPLLAPAAAAGAIAAAQPLATAANSLNFAGAFDEGGLIPTGSAGVVAEYGKELAGGTMIYNGSQSSLSVTGREATARKTGSSTNNFNINSYGNASPEAIARATVRMLKKGSKSVDNAVYDSMNRGRTNKGKRFNA